MKVKQECPECAKVGDATRANNRFMYHIHYVRNGRLIYLGKMRDASKLCRTYKKSRIVVCDRREHTSRTWWQSEDFPGERYENLLFEGGNFGVPDKSIMWEDVPEVPCPECGAIHTADCRLLFDCPRKMNETRKLHIADAK